ncbi:hypothetical protein [Klebsiella michiganensis]|uniref:hypothetical protein n=1 Tax=Klebsiella michiganensis TaxID=1134687 RepID=UPI000FF8D5C7|nr:hypothetical protein [Klebsiella michiganensis]QAS67588.1 hypothetical protein KOCBH_05158 [Klebsiella michiganensis]
MTKSTITREQLEEWVAQFDEDGGCDATDRQLEALIRQSLAAMDSEPVTEVCEDYAIRYISSGPAPREGLHPGDKLYRHAQPAPVMPDFKKLARELVDNLVDCGGLDEGVKEKYLEWAEKACRAAMLNGGKS